MNERYIVTCNAAPGFPGVYRGYPARYDGVDANGRPIGEPAGTGWLWPAGGIEIEVTSDEMDPSPESQPKGAGAHRVIGQKTWKALQDDKRIFARPAGEDAKGTSAALAAANAKIADLEAQLAAAKGESTPAEQHAHGQPQTHGKGKSGK